MKLVAKSNYQRDGPRLAVRNTNKVGPPHSYQSISGTGQMFPMFYLDLSQIYPGIKLIALEHRTSEEGVIPEAETADS
jgi:hypothetical protein